MITIIMKVDMASFSRLIRRTALVFLLSITPVLAQEPDGLTLDQAVAEALARNAELLAMRSTARGMSERSTQERALPNPVFQYGAMNPSDEVRLADNMETRFTIEQELPGFGKRELRGRVADLEAAMEWVRFRVRENALTLMVRETAYDLAAVQSNLTLLRQEQAVLTSMEQAAQTRFSVGAVESMDVIRSQSETLSLEQNRIELEQREKSLEARLNELLNRSPEKPVRRVAVTDPPAVKPEPEVLLKRALEMRPEIEEARLALERSAYGGKLAAREGWPDFMVSAERRNNRDEDDEVMLMVGLTLPIWRNRIRAGLREAGHARDAGQQGLEAAKQAAIFEIRDTCYALENARRAYELNRLHLTPQAEQRFAAADAGYRTGKVTFNDYLESERFLLQARVMTVLAQADYRRQSARLDRAMGSSWEQAQRRKP